MIIFSWPGKDSSQEKQVERTPISAEAGCLKGLSWLKVCYFIFLSVATETAYDNVQHTLWVALKKVIRFIVV